MKPEWMARLMKLFKEDLECPVMERELLSLGIAILNL